MAASTALGGAGKAISNRNFRYYWMGNTLSILGFWLNKLALGVFTWELTESPFFAWHGGFRGLVSGVRVVFLYGGYCRQVRHALCFVFGTSCRLRGSFRHGHVRYRRRHEYRSRLFQGGLAEMLGLQLPVLGVTVIGIFYWAWASRRLIRETDNLEHLQW